MLYSAQYMTLAQKKKKVRYTLVYIYKYNFSTTFVISVKKQRWHGRFKEGSRARNIRSELYRLWSVVIIFYRKRDYSPPNIKKKRRGSKKR